jgi:hypothetical protein
METMRAYAERFARAVMADDRDSISSYLVEGLEPAISGTLAALPRPIQKAEVLYVSVPDAEGCISLIAFSGPTEVAGIQAVWVEAQQQPSIVGVQMIKQNGSRLPGYRSRSHGE